MTFVVLHCDMARIVVMTKEDDVESRNVAGNILCFVLFIMESADATVPTAMEKTDDYVGMLLVLDNVNPLGGRLCHILEIEAAPQFLGKPVGDSRSDHANNSHLHSLALDDGVGLDIG